jgi:hypothetical protein
LLDHFFIFSYTSHWQVRAILAILENRRVDPGGQESITREQLRAVRAVLDGQEGEESRQNRWSMEPRDLHVESFF